MNENHETNRKGSYTYYILTAVASLLVLCFAPFLGSTVGLQWNVPTTVAGWVVWCTVRLLVAALNVLIFYCFMEQAKLNVRNDQRYVEAKARWLGRPADDEPMSPHTYEGRKYRRKGVMVFFSTLVAAIGIGNALLTYDYVALITYLTTIAMGIVWGIINMNNAQIYWTEEFPRWVDWQASNAKEVSHDNN